MSANARQNGVPSIPSTMRAWQFSSVRGGLEKNLRLNESTAVPAHDVKALGSDKVLVKVLAAAINPVDYKVAELPVVGRLVMGKNAVPGLDFAGVVAVSAQSQDGSYRPIKEGQAVFGRFSHPQKHGTLAEYVVVKKSALAMIPLGVAPQDAAGVGTAGLTAYQAIVPHVNPGAGDAVFVNGGSGGTGVWSIQIAKALGCYVVVSCSGGNTEFCKNLGADEVIDYKTTDLVEALKKRSAVESSSSSPEGAGAGQAGRKFALIVDNVGIPRQLFWQSRHYLSPEGKFVQVGIESSLGGVWDLLMKWTWPGFLGGGRRKFEMLMVKKDAEQLGEIAKWMQQGKVRTPFHNGEVVPFEDAAKAFALLKTHRTTGKLVIQVNDG